MRLLLDTHSWLWWINLPARLSPQALAIIADRENQIFLSAASSWEIAIKYALGKLPLPEPPGSFVPKRLARDQMVALAVQHVHALKVAELPHHHRDPFDRLLIAQAQVERMPILTADTQFQDYGVDIIEAE